MSSHTRPLLRFILNKHDKTLDEITLDLSGILLNSQNGQPLLQGTPPPFIDEGREGVTMWFKYPYYLPMYNFLRICARVAHHPFALSSQFLLVAGILHDIVR